MGCGISQAAVVDQNANQPSQQPAKQLPPAQSQPVQKPKPVEPAPQPEPPVQAPPPKQPTPPPPPPKEPTPPPPKEPTPPPPKEPTPPPPIEPTPPPPKEPTPEPPEEKLTAEVVNEFIDLEKQIQRLDKMQHEERLMLYKFELKNTEDSVKVKEGELETAHQVALKEYADYTNFNIQEYMMNRQISYLSPTQVDEAINKEKDEFMEAKNKVESCQAEVEKLQSEIVAITEKLNLTTAKVDELHKLQDKQDGLLENVFNGDYGSDLEDQLENSYEDTREKRDRYILALMKWRSSKEMLSKACSQLAYSASRWNQIKDYPNLPNQARFYMATETRNAMIAGHMNVRHAAEQLQVALPYWNEADDKNLVMSINIIYNDVISKNTFDRALAWFKYYHWRMALCLNWIEQALALMGEGVNNVEKELKEKYHELKLERLKLIQVKVKEILGVDINIDEFTQQLLEEESETDDNYSAAIFNIDNSQNVEEIAEMPAPKENEDPTSLEMINAENASAVKEEREKNDNEEESKPEEEGGEEQKPKDEAAEVENSGDDKVNHDGDKPTEPTDPVADDKPKAPPIMAIPLEELAPVPSQEELFGKVEKLLESVENAEETLEKNKMRQEQNLQEQLRRRRSRRKRIRDQAQHQQPPHTEAVEPSTEQSPKSQEPSPAADEVEPAAPSEEEADKPIELVQEETPKDNNDENLEGGEQKTEEPAPPPPSEEAPSS